MLFLLTPPKDPCEKMCLYMYICVALYLLVNKLLSYNEIINIIDWLRTNKLTLTTDKTHFVLFRRQQKQVDLTQSVMISGQHIAQVKSMKFGGIIIDESL